MTFVLGFCIEMIGSSNLGYSWFHNQRGVRYFAHIPIDIVYWVLFFRSFGWSRYSDDSPTSICLDKMITGRHVLLAAEIADRVPTVSEHCRVPPILSRRVYPKQIDEKSAHVHFARRPIELVVCYFGLTPLTTFLAVGIIRMITHSWELRPFAYVFLKKKHI